MNNKWFALVLVAMISLSLLLIGFMAVLFVPWFAPTRHDIAAYWIATRFWYLGIVLVLIVPFALPYMWKAWKAWHFHSHEKSLSRATRTLVLETTSLIASARENRDNVDVAFSDRMTPTSVKVITSVMAAQRRSVQEVAPQPDTKELPAPAQPPFPTSVNYTDIRAQIPHGHILVGIGRLGVETKNAIVGACLWIVGLSGTGKTSTTVLRVEERASDGHYFLGVDPHWFKPESLYHAIYQSEEGQPLAYAPRFLKPMAKTAEEMKQILTMFLNEFNGRKGSTIAKPWKKITLLVDEVDALMDPTAKEGKEIADMLPSIARICGQEARNFNMGGIFISQQATGLAWLRKMALMIIVHQLLMESEKKLALNGDTEAIEDMKSWPIGRTYVYGVGFTEGPRTVQQPYFSAVPRIVDAVPPSQMEDLQPKQSSVEDMGRQWEAAQEAVGRDTDKQVVPNSFELKKLLSEIGKMKANGASNDAILRQYGVTPGGRNNQNLKALTEIISESEA